MENGLYDEFVTKNQNWARCVLVLNGSMPQVLVGYVRVVCVPKSSTDYLRNVKLLKFATTFDKMETKNKGKMYQLSDIASSIEGTICRIILNREYMKYISNQPTLSLVPVNVRVSLRYSRMCATCQREGIRWDRVGNRREHLTPRVVGLAVPKYGP